MSGLGTRRGSSSSAAPEASSRSGRRGGVAVRLVEVNEQWATIDGRRVSMSGLPESLRGDVRAAVVHELAAQAAELGREIPAEIVDAGERTSVCVAPDGTLVERGRDRRPLVLVAAVVVMAVLASWAGWSLLNRGGENTNPTATAPSSDSSSSSSSGPKSTATAEPVVPAPVTAPPASVPELRRAVAKAASVKTGEVRFIVRATRLPATVVVKLARPGQPTATRRVTLTKTPTKLWMPATAGERYSWAVRVQDVAPIRGRVRVLAPPAPPTPPVSPAPSAPSPVSPPYTPPPSSGSGSDDPPPSSGGDSGGSGGSGGGGGSQPPPAQPDGGPPRGPIRG